MPATVENVGAKIEDMATRSIILDWTPIFVSVFDNFFRDYLNFQGITRTFLGVSTISGVLQGFQGFQGSLDTLKYQQSSIVALSKETKLNAKEIKFIDLPALPPCCNVLWIHPERASFVAKVWRSLLKNKIDEEGFASQGWDDYANIQWINQRFPDDISGFFLDNLYDNKKYDFWSNNEESEDENED